MPVQHPVQIFGSGVKTRTHGYTLCSGRKIPVAFCDRPPEVNTGPYAVFTPKDKRCVHLRFTPAPC